MTCLRVGRRAPTTAQADSPFIISAISGMGSNALVYVPRADVVRFAPLGRWSSARADALRDRAAARSLLYHDSSRLVEFPAMRSGCHRGQNPCLSQGRRIGPGSVSFGACISWDQMQSIVAGEFQQLRDLWHLNHAAVAPWPRRTVEAVTRFAQENAERGSERYASWLAVERRLRERLARLIGSTRRRRHRSRQEHVRGSVGHCLWNRLAYRRQRRWHRPGVSLKSDRLGILSHSRRRLAATGYRPVR